MEIDRTLNGRNIAVIGLGLSGVAAAKLALEKGGEVYVSEIRTDQEARDSASRLRRLGIEVELGPHNQQKIATAETVVVSPGISHHARIIKDLAGKGIATMSEPEFAFRFFDGPLIAVTGTNGKTTTAMLIAQFLKEDGQYVALGGNVGGGMAPPASELALSEDSPSWYVLELSSFQLSGVINLKPSIGVITNLAPDHLDRYESVATYYGDKAKIFANADNNSRWVLNGSDLEVLDLAQNVPGEHFYFSEEYTDSSAAYVEDDMVTVELVVSLSSIIGTDSIPLLGKHNIANVLAAALTAKLAGATDNSIAEGVKKFSSLPHRTEKVGQCRGIAWVNDSKATNISATINGITSLDGQLLVLLGGQDKGEDFTRLIEPLKANNSKVIAFGEAGDRLYQQLNEDVMVRLVEGSFEDLMASAFEWAERGDTVLLSPACPSFDMFRDYQERGDHFRKLVNKFLEIPNG